MKLCEIRKIKKDIEHILEVFIKSKICKNGGMRNSYRTVLKARLTNDYFYIHDLKLPDFFSGNDKEKIGGYIQYYYRDLGDIIRDKLELEFKIRFDTKVINYSLGICIENGESYITLELL